MSDYFDININKMHGYSRASRFECSVAFEPLSDLTFIKWAFGDGSIVYGKTNVEHYYAVPGEYEISVFAYTNDNRNFFAKKIITVENFLKESVYFDFIPPPAFAAHYPRYPHRIHITSSNSGDHYVDLYAQFSRSYPHQEPQNKWSFLRPQWRFLDLDGNPIWSVKTTDTPIKIAEDGELSDSGLTIGVSGYAEFFFVDDIYNQDLVLNGDAYTTIWATMQTSALRVKTDSFNADLTLPGFSNSTAIAYAPCVVLRRQPEKLKITENGIRRHTNPRWTGAEHPIVIKSSFQDYYPDDWIDGVGVKEYDKEANFARYIPLETTSNVPITAGATLINTEFTPTTEFQWIDDTTYKVAGYYKGKFTTDTPYAFNCNLTAAANLITEPTSASYFNPLLWLSNPAAGTFTVAQYYKNNSPEFKEVTIPNLNVAHVKTFEMPIIQKVDFNMDAMALSGFHGIYSIAAMPAPTYHAWVADSELDMIYRLSSQGTTLCSIDLNKILEDNKLNYLINKKISPAHIALDSHKNLWVTLYDTVSVLKFDASGRFLFATTPLSSVNFDIPNPLRDWYVQSSYTDILSIPNDDHNIIEPTGIDTDLDNNIWTTYSNQFKGFILKYTACGDLMHVISAPVSSTPHELLVDKNNDVWICYNAITWNVGGVIEKRNSDGVLLSSFKGLRNPNYLTLDLDQNLWFTLAYNRIATINNLDGSMLTYTISGLDLCPNDYPKHNLMFDTRESTEPWFDEDQNSDETALEGLACDMRGFIYALNSIENQVYVFHSRSREKLDRFYINPQGFLFYQDDQLKPTRMDYYLWTKSLQAAGDWTGWKWTNKYGPTQLPYYSNYTQNIYVSGISEPINFYDRSVYTAFKINEDFNLSKKMREIASMSVIGNSDFFFDNFLGSIYGKEPFYQDDLATSSYEKIANYVMNTADPDTCEIPQLYNMLQSVDIDAEDFQLSYPPAIKKVMNLASINLSKLIGVECKCGLNFEKPNDCANIEHCPYCKKLKQSNRGELITSLSYQITAGTPVVMKKKGINKYRLIPSGKINDSLTYTLNDLATSIGLGSEWQNYHEFYEFVNTYNGGVIENLIDWNSDQTTINRTLSTSNDWFKEEGLLDMFFNYELHKGLGLLND